MKKVVPKYQPTDLRLVHHLFPLPYHHNAFSVAQAAMTVAHALHPSKFQVWMETMYNNQEMYVRFYPSFYHGNSFYSFYNTPTASQSQIQVTQQLKSLAMKTFPELTLEQWNSGMSGHGGTKMDVLTRTAWKYACSRGVTGTPIFFINGVPVSAQSDWSVQQWIELLDPLIQENRKPQTTEREIQHTSRMLEVTKRPIFAMNRVQAATERCMTEFRACEFMNETSMCCNATEYCILRQGCVQK